MTLEQARELCEKHDNEYFKGTEGWYHALGVFMKYDANFGKTKTELAASHDMLFITGHNEAMSEEDILILYRNGFHLDNETEGWTMFT